MYQSIELEQIEKQQPELAEESRRDFLRNIGIGVVGIVGGLQLSGDLAHAQTGGAAAPPEPVKDAETKEAELQKLRAETDSVRANTQKARAEADKTRAEILPDEIKKKTDNAKLRELTVKNDNDADWPHDVAEVATTAAAAGGILTAFGALATAVFGIRKWSGDRETAEQNRADEARKARADRLRTKLAAEDAKYAEIHKRLLDSEDKWEGADVDLLMFAQPGQDRYKRFERRTFNLTRDRLRKRTHTAKHDNPTPAQRNIISAFLNVIKPLGSHEHNKRISDIPEVPLLDASHVNLDGANLIGEDLCKIDFTGATFDNASLDVAQFTGARFTGASFENVSAKGAVFGNNEGLTEDQKKYLISKQAVFKEK